MITSKQLEQDIKQINTLRIISQSYAQIASIRIKNVRDSVLYTRLYLKELTGVFSEVLLSYKKEAKTLLKKGEATGGLTFLSHNGRTVVVFLSSNARLYGDLILRTFNFFVEQIKQADVEVTIVGKYGLSLFQQRFPNRAYTYFDFPDSKIDSAAFNSISAHLTQYDLVKFYYPEFENAIVQSPKAIEVSAEEAISFDLESNKSGHKKNYFFEPDLETILVFFESQVFSSLFEQTIKESQLAKFGSRVLAMDKAAEKIKVELKNKNIARLKLRHSIQEKKQIQLQISLRNF